MPLSDAWTDVGIPVHFREQLKLGGEGRTSPLLSTDERAVQATLAEMHGSIRVPLEAPPSRVSLAQWQTPIRDQRDRGTCYTFAGIAALEAAIKRQYGIELDLSEQYLFHVHCCSDPLGGGVNPPTIETGTSLRGGGGGGQDILEALCRIAVPTEADCPYLTEAELIAIRAGIPASDPPGATPDSFANQEQIDAVEFADQVVPLAARAEAHYQVVEWATIPDRPTRAQLQSVLADNHEVVVDIQIAGPQGGGHCLLLIGYDEPSQTWLFKNSWGGDQFTVVPYSDGDFVALSACYITGIAPIDQPVQVHAQWIGHWFMDHDGWRGELVIRRFTDRRQHLGEHQVPLDHQPTKLGDYYRDGIRYDAMGSFEDAGRTMVCWIADDAVRQTVPTLAGTKFTGHIFGADPMLAAGFGTKDGETWGFSLSRQPFPPETLSPVASDSWAGDWEINHDGQVGKLSVQGAAGQALTLSYVDSTGQAHAATGSIDPKTPARLLAWITFGAQPQSFDLRLHGWESTRFSGITGWAGRTFGVQGHRAN